MNDTPIFQKVWLDNLFKPFNDEYTDRLTPEVMRQLGFQAGVQAERERVLNVLRKRVKNQSQALQAAIYYIEHTEDE